MKLAGLAIAGAIAGAFWLCPVAASAQSRDAAQIKTLEDQFAAAFKAKDVDAIMKVYVADDTLFVFDLVPPRQYVGAAAYRKDWQELFAGFDGPVDFTISDLAIVADGKLAYSHSIQRVKGKDKKGQPIDFTVRVTDAYRKIGGHWLVAMEHVSVPVDIESGKPDMQSKP